MNIFSRRLKILLKENKITMYKLAKDLKYSKSTILNWCHGITEPRATDLAFLAKYFDVTADYLIGLEND